ncbi:MAG: hypothetical protein IK099_09835 [Clostridia bacterium]|nr:hypothetical protein [Clostridia bacterium]
MKNVLKIALALLVAVTFHPHAGSAGQEENGTVSCGAWIVYWNQNDGMEEALGLDPLPDRLIAFEALFGADKSVILEHESQELLRRMQSKFPAEKIYLSVVNDLVLSKGGYSNKDTQLLRDLLLTEEAREAHIRELTYLVDRWHLKGLEIDYENIHGDRAIWKGFTVFLKDLYAEMQKRGVTLRVALEWDSILYTNLPEGPEYSIMCYNLFGFHSGPGPKADKSFLRKIAGMYSGRNDCCMALAAGGIDWIGNSADTEVTARQAEYIFRSKNLKTKRDPDSGALYGTYMKDGQTHTVWYADAETIRQWMEILQEYGYSKFDFFCLGGNTVKDWNTLIMSQQSGQREEGGDKP